MKISGETNDAKSQHSNYNHRGELVLLLVEFALARLQQRVQFALGLGGALELAVDGKIAIGEQRERILIGQLGCSAAAQSRSAPWRSPASCSRWASSTRALSSRSLGLPFGSRAITFSKSVPSSRRMMA